MDYLSIEKALELVGNCRLVFNKRSRKVYSTEENEKIMINSSKLYETGVSYWFGINPNTLKISKEQNVGYFCFTLGYEGVIKLPISILNKYIEFADTSFNKEKTQINRYHIRIKYDKEIILYNSNQEFLITEFLLYNENIILSDLKNLDLDKIRKQAENFTNYEKQYYLSEKITKHRKESKAQKQRIAILENHMCQICSFQYEYVGKKGQKSWIIEVDHILDKGKGGGETIDNLWVLCPNCHSKKTQGVIIIDREKQTVIENGRVIDFNDNHLGWKNSSIKH